MATRVRAIHLFYPMKKGGRKSPNKPVAGVVNSDAQMKKLGNRIKQLRIARGYTSYEYFAYDHNISRAQFGRYEKGQDLRFSSLLKVIHAFGISVSDFFAEGFD